MTFEIYGIREIGSLELRYIGQTQKGGEFRLRYLKSLARAKIGHRNMREWLEGCGYQVEVIRLGLASTREEARAKEIVAIQAFSAVGHRLLNSQGVPRAHRKAA